MMLNPESWPAPPLTDLPAVTGPREGTIHSVEALELEGAHSSGEVGRDHVHGQSHVKSQH